MHPIVDPAQPAARTRLSTPPAGRGKFPLSDDSASTRGRATSYAKSTTKRTAYKSRYAPLKKLSRFLLINELLTITSHDPWL